MILDDRVADVGAFHSCDGPKIERRVSDRGVERVDLVNYNPSAPRSHFPNVPLRDHLGLGSHLDRRLVEELQRVEVDLADVAVLVDDEVLAHEDRVTGVVRRVENRDATAHVRVSRDGEGLRQKTFQPGLDVREALHLHDLHVAGLQLVVLTGDSHVSLRSREFRRTPRR